MLNSLLLYAAIALVAIGLGWLSLRMLKKTASAGGEDKEGRRALEELAKREKAADEIRAGPRPMGRDQLDRLRKLGKN
jgi:hypothetical protein